ncbi:sensor histidine kinase [Paenibacillus paeoniae]|nr:ATP-binding protein [Paenibacillus paeoniae]
MINGLVLAIVIWLVGVSVKDFACFLVDQYEFVGKEKQVFFNSTMQYYLVRASLIAILVAALIYYILMRKVLLPLQMLMKSTRIMTEGKYPEPIEVASNDETGQLSRHFNQMIMTLKQTEHGRRQMLSDISHELRTPLSNLNGYLEALSSGVIQGEPELYRSLHEESMHLTKLVDQLHQLSILEGKRLNQPLRELVNLDTVVQAACQRFELELEGKGIQSDIRLEPGKVQGDEIGLKQVVTNLIQNAIQYDHGGWISIIGEAAGQNYTVTISNKGQPIPRDQANLVFERFYRIDPSRHRETGGTGLGLAIAKEIVEQHDGEIGLTTDGLEHTFWFTLKRLESS